MTSGIFGASDTVECASDHAEEMGLGEAVLLHHQPLTSTQARHSLLPGQDDMEGRLSCSSHTVSAAPCASSESTTSPLPYVHAHMSGVKAFFPPGLIDHGSYRGDIQ